MEVDGKTCPKLPIDGKRNILITSALPYVNNVPHLGNIIGCVLSADVYARYCSLRDYNAIYICGTDEYGTATETKALEENCTTPKEICDKYHAIHKEVYDWFDISFDKFGRISTPEQTVVCQAIFQKLWENNWLSENTMMQQLYCDTCKKFLADRLVEGSCPFEGRNYYDSARSITSPTASTRFPLSRCCGDKNFPAMKFGGRIVYSKTASEVDKRAMQLLNALETKRDGTGRAIVGLDIEWRPSFRKGVLPGKVATVQICIDESYCDVMHIFHSGIPTRLQQLIEDSTLVKVGIGIDGDSVKLFHDYGVSIKDVEDLSDLANQKIGGNSKKKWGLASLTETLVSKKLLKPNEIRLGNWEARSLSKKQLQYAATDAYTSWHLYQVLKDLPNADSMALTMNEEDLKLMFPSTQLGTGENWRLMKTLSVTEYLNYEDGKFSKRKGVGVFGKDVKDTNIPVEVWRYYLLTNRPEVVSDTSFSWKDLQAKLNGELLSNLGNFVNRVLSFIAKPENTGYGSVIPDAPGAESHPATKSLAEKVEKLVDEYVEAMEKVKLKQGLRTAMSISNEGNIYLQANQFWKLYNEDKPSCAIVIRTAAGLVHLLARLLEPFMPSFSREVFKQLNLPPLFSLSKEKGEVLLASRPWEILPASHKIGTPQPLFRELKDDEVQQYREKFAGSQVDRCARDEEAATLVDQINKTKLAYANKQKSASSKCGGKSKSRLDIRVGKMFVLMFCLVIALSLPYL